MKALGDKAGRVMDDQRTRETLDSLAELFLTGTQQPGGRVAAKADDGPQLQDTWQDAPDKSQVHEALQGPEPYRLKPKTTIDSRTPRPPRAGRAQEAPPRGGPRLHLAGQPQDSASQDPPAVPAHAADDQQKSTVPAAMVEAVVLGNLPGLSGPWLTQYAQRLADRHGPVAIVHLDDDQVDLELIEPSGQWRHRQVPSAAQGPVDLLQTLVTDDTAPVRTILIHLDPDQTPDGLKRLLTIDCWTMLSGCDDAAVAAAASTIERWVKAEPRLAGHSLGLMLMGSDHDASVAAAAKLRQAVGHRLHQPVELLADQQKIGPVNVRALGRFETASALWPALRNWLIQLAEPMDDDPGSVGANVDAGWSSQSNQDAQPWFDQKTREPMAEARASAGRQRKAPDFKGAGQAFDDAAPGAEQTADDEVDLAVFIERGPGAVPGALALEARCPHQPGTQLVLDERGTLHLLARHCSQGYGGDATSGLRAAIVDLMASRQWVGDHLGLLELTQRQCRFDHEAEPVLHLFTDRADLATGLANRLGGMLKLHLLQKVTLERESGWVCTLLG